MKCVCGKYKHRWSTNNNGQKTAVCLNCGRLPPHTNEQSRKTPRKTKKAYTDQDALNDIKVMLLKLIENEEFVSVDDLCYSASQIKHRISSKQ